MFAKQNLWQLPRNIQGLASAPQIHKTPTMPAQVTSHVTFQVNDMAGMCEWLLEKKEEVAGWPGLDSMVFSKTDENKIMSVVIYEDAAAMAANSDRFKKVIGEAAGLQLFTTFTRIVGEVIVSE